MDEDTKDLVKIGVEVVLSPFTKPLADLIGILGGDRLSDYRAQRRQARATHTMDILQQTDRLLVARNVQESTPRNDDAIEELLSIAQDEGRAELQDIWARLLAAALDPARAQRFRREFISVAKQLEPLDATTLAMLETPASMEPTRLKWIAERQKVSEDEVHNAFRNLQQLGLAENGEGRNQKIFPKLTALGRQFLMALR